ICRHGDNHEIAIHWRPDTCGGPCGTWNDEAHLGGTLGGIDGEDAIFMKLDVRPLSIGTGVVARGYASLNGRDWQLVGAPVTFRTTYLTLQGIAASSNDPNFVTRDGQAPKFLFGNVMKNGVRYFQRSSGYPALLSPDWGSVASFSAVQSIGNV